MHLMGELGARRPFTSVVSNDYASSNLVGCTKHLVYGAAMVWPPACHAGTVYLTARFEPVIDRKDSNSNFKNKQLLIVNVKNES